MNGNAEVGHDGGLPLVFMSPHSAVRAGSFATLCLERGESGRLVSRIGLCHGEEVTVVEMGELHEKLATECGAFVDGDVEPARLWAFESLLAKRATVVLWQEIPDVEVRLQIELALESSQITEVRERVGISTLNHFWWPGGI